ncbi:MAG: hypothetical protein LAP87_06605 [Acidobacteriia bacterium]|nr:hypothetical protein [Terriglobia bacterium]
MTRAPITAEDLLAGCSAVHEVTVPPHVLSAARDRGEAGLTVQLRPLTIGQFLLIMKAAKEDSSLIPLLMVKESLVEPEIALGQIKQMSVGLVAFLVEQIRAISGLGKKKSQ